MKMDPGKLWNITKKWKKPCRAQKPRTAAKEITGAFYLRTFSSSPSTRAELLSFFACPSGQSWTLCHHCHVDYYFILTPRPKALLCPVTPGSVQLLVPTYIQGPCHCNEPQRPDFSSLGNMHRPASQTPKQPPQTVHLCSRTQMLWLLCKHLTPVTLALLLHRVSAYQA